jgi:hypothetical protein
MIPIEASQAPPGWSQQQCPTCGMVFAMVSHDEPSARKAKETLTEELNLHVRQSHIDLPSTWNAEDQQA